MALVVRSQNGYVAGGLFGYIKRRSRRILPPYYATLFFCVLLAAAIFILEKFTSFEWNEIAGKGPFYPYFSFSDLFSHLVLIHNIIPDAYMAINPPLWTVATEWQLYFLFPLFLLPIWRCFGLTLVVIAAFLIGIAPLYLFNGLFETASPWFIGLFALGMAAADIGLSQKLKLINMKNSLPWGVLTIIFTSVAFLTEWRRLGLHIWISESFFGLAAACLFIYCTKLAIAIDQRMIDKSLKQRIFLDTQDYSFVQCVSPKFYNIKAIAQRLCQNKSKITLAAGKFRRL